MLNVVKKLFFEVDKEVDNSARLWHRKNVLSPDIWFLEQFRQQLIFVADDMMRGKRNHSLISDDAYAGGPIHPTCYTLDHFTFWKKDLGNESFPIPLDGTYVPSNWLRVAPVPARIKGELYAIPPRLFLKLDEHRHNGVQYQRRRVNITLPYRGIVFDEKHPLPDISPDCLLTIRAWMYIGVEDYWDDQIGDMYTVKEVNHYEFAQPKVWIDKFYRFE